MSHDREPGGDTFRVIPVETEEQRKRREAWARDRKYQDEFFTLLGEGETRLSTWPRHHRIPSDPDHQGGDYNPLKRSRR